MADNGGGAKGAKHPLGHPSQYRTMLRVASIAGVLAALGLGFVSGGSDKKEWEGFAVLGLYLLGFLPSYLYLYFIVKAHRTGRVSGGTN